MNAGGSNHNIPKVMVPLKWGCLKESVELLEEYFLVDQTNIIQKYDRIIKIIKVEILQKHTTINENRKYGP